MKRSHILFGILLIVTLLTFISREAIAAVVDSYSEANYDVDGNLDGNPRGFGQSFTGIAGTLTSAQFYLKKSGSPANNMTAKLYAHSGTFGTNSIPTGAALATSNTIDASTLTTSYALISFTFGTPFTLAAGTKYVISMEYTGADPDNVVIAADSSAPTHPGNNSELSNLGVWEAGGNDMIFYVNADVPDPGPGVIVNGGTIINGGMCFSC